MYLHKEVTDTFSKKKVNMSDYIRLFSFVPFLHPERRQVFRTTAKDFIPGIADISAAVATTFLVMNPDKDIIQEALKCCKSILHSQEYATINAREIQLICTQKETNAEIVVVVLGCQTSSILNKRVDAAINLEKIINNDVNIIFSGAAPGSEARIPNESAEMFEYYQSKQKKQKSFQDLTFCKTVTLENKSQSTNHNISEVLDLINIKFKGKDIHLFIVSSSFHLVRIDWELTKFKAQLLSYNIKNLFLCGAENANNVKVISMNERYLKQLFFGIFSHLMTSESFYSTSDESLSESQLYLKRIRSALTARKAHPEIMRCYSNAKSNDPVIEIINNAYNSVIDRVQPLSVRDGQTPLAVSLDSVIDMVKTLPRLLSKCAATNQLMLNPDETGSHGNITDNSELSEHDVVDILTAFSYVHRKLDVFSAPAEN